MSDDNNARRVAEVGRAHLALVKTSRFRRSQLPAWWEGALAAAPYHLADCDWVTIGVSIDHCGCGLTRVIDAIIAQQSLTRDQFEDAYAARSGVSVEALRACGRVVRPCQCGERDCKGWQSVRVDPNDTWPEDSPYPDSDPRFKKR